MKDLERKLGKKESELREECKDKGEGKKVKEKLEGKIYNLEKCLKWKEREEKNLIIKSAKREGDWRRYLKK